MSFISRVPTLNTFNGIYSSKHIQKTVAQANVLICHRHINLKPKLKEYVHCDYKDNMDYGIYALTTGYVKESAMEAGRIEIVRKAKTRQVTKIVSETPFTKKPVGTRMGKGKGKLDYWASKAIAGQVLYEFNCENDALAKDAFQQVKAKLPVRLHLRIKPKSEREVLSGEALLQLFKEHNERKERLGIKDGDFLMYQK